MKAKRLPRISLIGFAIFILSMCFVTIYTLTGGSLSVRHFDADKQGNLYIGRQGRIEVWRDCELVNTIAKDYYTQRGYGFRVTEDDRVMVYPGTEIIELTLDGVELAKTPDPDGKEDFVNVYREPPIVGADGATYSVDNGIFHFQIIRNSGRNQQVMFQLPTIAIVARILIWVGVITFIVAFSFAMRGSREIMKAKGMSH